MIRFAVATSLPRQAPGPVLAPLYFPPNDDSGVSPARLEQHVRTLVRTFTPRSHKQPKTLDRAAAYIRGELAAAGAEPWDQPVRIRGKTYRNVVASFGPETEERVVVGAHYDAAGASPGADDNASGVAGLLELARLLGGTPPPLRVELVAFTLEEPRFARAPQHVGSATHAASLRRQGVRVRAMIALEMIGYFTDAPASQRYPVGVLKAFYPSRGDYITVVGRMAQVGLVRRVAAAMRGATPLPVSAINAPRWLPGIDFSDHSSYWDAGYPAVMVTDTAFYRNPNYHTTRDLPETLDYLRMADVVRGVHAAVLDLARP